MGSNSLGALNISLRAMDAAQAGINITGQNIANANTEGYSRRIVTFESDEVVVAGFNSVLRNGVKVSQVVRARDMFLDNQFRVHNSELGYSEEVSKTNIAANEILGEPGENGISARVTDLYNAASDLAANPQLNSAKVNFVNAAKTLANTMNLVDSNLARLSSEFTEPVSGSMPIAVSELNELLEQFAEITNEISVQDDDAPDISYLQDKRDLLLDKISKYMDFTINRDGAGEFSSLTISVNESEAKVTGTVAFTSPESSISPAILKASGNNTLELSVDNGNDTSVGPFVVNFDDNSTAIDVVNKINKTFAANGGYGSIAALDADGKLVIATANMRSALSNADAEVTTVGGRALTALGLSAGTTNGADPETRTVVATAGTFYKFKIVEGSLDHGVDPYQLQLVTANDAETVQGTVHNFKGIIGGMFDSVNKDIPELRSELDAFAMTLKTNVNRLLNLGYDEGGAAGPDLFTGYSAGTLQVADAVDVDSSSINPGHTGAFGDGSIANAIAEIFFGNTAVVSDGVKSDQLYIDSSSSSAVLSTMPVVPGDDFKIDVRGIIDDNGIDVNAGTNGYGGGSLVQIEFLDADGAVLGSALNFSATQGPPTDKVSYSGTIPADAAFVRLKMNSSFRDSSLANNEGYFNIAVYQGTASETKVARNLNSGYNQVVGEFATRANFAEQTADIDAAQLSQIKNKKDSVSGVSLEEEASNLIRFQSAFQAAARVMNVVDRIMEEITNLLR